jgi:alanyl-tRNA synthetase
MERFVEHQKNLTREIDRLRKDLAGGTNRDLASEAREVNGVHVLGAQVDLGDAKALREMADQLRDKLAPAVILLGSSTQDGKALLVCSVSKELVSRWQAGAIVREAAMIVGGAGGGRADFAQAGGPDASKLEDAVNRVYGLVN